MDLKREKDVEIESEGIIFLVEEQIENIIRNVDIDYKDSGLQTGFKMRVSG